MKARDKLKQVCDAIAKDYDTDIRVTFHRTKDPSLKETRVIKNVRPEVLQARLESIIGEPVVIIDQEEI